MSASTATPNGYNTSNFSWTPSTQQPATPMLDGLEAFSLDFDFNFSNTDMEAMMMNATQDFWNSFPGETGFQ